VTTLAHLPDVRSLQEPVGGQGVDLPGIEGSLGARRGVGGASGREGPLGALEKGICRASGPTINVGGAAPACLVASDPIGGQVYDADA
jgi:hypothetical protein